MMSTQTSNFFCTRFHFCHFLPSILKGHFRKKKISVKLESPQVFPLNILQSLNCLQEAEAWLFLSTHHLPSIIHRASRDQSSSTPNTQRRAESVRTLPARSEGIPAWRAFIAFAPMRFYFFHHRKFRTTKAAIKRVWAKLRFNTSDSI